VSEIVESNAANPGLNSGGDHAYRLAGFWPRFWAFLIDITVIALTSQIVFRLVWPAGLGYDTVQSYVLYNSLFPGIWGVAYLILITGFFGQTLGKMIIGLKVIQTDGQALTWPTVIVRELFGRPLSQLLGTNLGYLVCAVHPRKQSLHDLISDTYVVHDPDLKPGRWINITAS
jgi:uncharacterized RDD family membrane protein YckC